MDATCGRADDELVAGQQIDTTDELARVEEPPEPHGRDRRIAAASEMGRDRGAELGDRVALLHRDGHVDRSASTAIVVDEKTQEQLGHGSGGRGVGGPGPVSGRRRRRPAPGAG